MKECTCEGTPLLANANALGKARVGPAEVRDYCQVDEAGRSLLRTAMQQLHMSARAYDELSEFAAPSSWRGR